MEKSDIVIIGGVACGCKAAATLARRNPNLRITLFQKEDDLSYATCGLPYFASGDVDSFRALTETSYNVVRDVEYFRKSKGFNAVTESEVIEINRIEKKVKVKDLKTGDSYDHGYDKLVISTGATPMKLPIDIPKTDRIMPFTRPEDARNFRKLAQTGEIGSALVVGGGFIGCEMAEATASLWGIETTLVEMENQLLPYALDEDMAIPVAKEMEANDIKFHLNTAVTEFELDDDKVKVKLSNDEQLQVDYVFLCVGVNPASHLAEAAGLELGESGGIKVNEYMQTSDPDIYAGGDVVESIHQITGKPIYLPLGSIANRHGRIIADHIAGGDEKFPGVLGAFMIKVFDLNAGSVGLNQRAADEAGINANSVWASFVDKPDYYPESKPISLKMVFNPEDRSLLGIQAVGKGDVVRRIDVFSAFLQNKARIDDLLDFEHGYAPPYAEALDPLYQLGAIAKSLEHGFEQENPGNDYSRGDFILLDVREPEEVEALPFKAENAIHIPLNDLVDNIEKLDKSKKIVILCHRGMRSYQASHILKTAGFEHISYIAGGTTLAVKSLA
ncbi:MAG: FAD-dependent oxidoreductase [candidate division Zixibacteria bacterium]|nr:FAD-dependent oxidoreductase [candidate division Zixibacteria bacterium]NIS16990.1 FAD-dependent oxidoreductase [candidate division Zixibacteria bacterium]NIS46815.1 FAD-dependent oxidoreductase [candidate division Zixibacteria bacterium]NIT53361.1 FAD-dependent oxidoreductase [candidate division Zixibacteria bacterium]NIU14950.1 FAD-dependent oxidoreductase [candidate division Zixibacteria bacterium]